jgi:hypothetical protein
MGKGGGGGGGGSSGKYQVGAARSRAVQKEQDDILSRLPRGPRADREPDEGPGGDRGEHISRVTACPAARLRCAAHAWCAAAVGFNLCGTVSCC